MHRIINEVASLKLKIELEDVIPLAESITGKLYIDQIKDNPVEKFTWIPFGKSILSCFSKDTSAPIAKLQNNLATVLQDLGDYEGAKSLLEKAYKIIKKKFRCCNAAKRFVKINSMIFIFFRY